MTASPYASQEKITEAVEVIGAEHVGFGEMVLKQILVALAATASLTPPDKPFTLMVEAALGSFIANLDWTATNKTTSSGFRYEVWMQVDGGGYNFVASTTSQSYDYDAGSTAGVYDFQIKTFNDAGEGVSSNVASVTLPGEYNPQFLFLEDGTAMLLEDDGEILLESD